MEKSVGQESRNYSAKFETEVKGQDGHALLIGGQAPIRLQRTSFDNTDLSFESAALLPGRGMNTFQLQARCRGKDGATSSVPVIFSPGLEEAESFFGGVDPFGNLSFRYGGAFLIPFANRIRGRQLGDGRIEASLLGHELKLVANKKGKKQGAEPHAMHGLILRSSASHVVFEAMENHARVRIQIETGDFGVGWPSRTKLQFEFTLSERRFRVRIEAENVGTEPTPIGIGWHPYFSLPSGQRRQVELKIPASRRALVDNYDNVFPTGEIEDVGGTPYDFREPRALADLALDDCFLAPQGPVEIIDRAAGYGLRVRSHSPLIKAFQVYAPLDKSFVAVEPQFNLGDPFGKEWPANVDTGMVILAPGEKAVYEVELELFRP